MSKAIDTPSSEPATAPTPDELIRSVMTAQKRELSRQTFPELEPVEPEATDAGGQAGTRFTRRVHGRRVHGRIDRIKAWCPSRKHVLLGTFAVVIYLRPWLIPGLLFVTFWVGLIAYLTLGHDRTMEKLSNAWDWLLRKHPRTAERMRRIADAFALKFDALLDRLPDRWAEKLALPDLSQATKASRVPEDEPDPFDRLAKLPEVYRG